jgi:hypothetical protein
MVKNFKINHFMMRYIFSGNVQMSIKYCKISVPKPYLCQLLKIKI